MSAIAPPNLVGTPHTLGEKLRWARKRAGLSHDRLGAAAGVSRQHLIRLERGDHQPSDDLLARIAAAVELPVEFFAGSATERIEREQRERLAAVLQPLVDTLADELLNVVRGMSGPQR